MSLPASPASVEAGATPVKEERADAVAALHDACERGCAWSLLGEPCKGERAFPPCRRRHVAAAEAAVRPGGAAFAATAVAAAVACREGATGGAKERRGLLRFTEFWTAAPDAPLSDAATAAADGRFCSRPAACDALAAAEMRRFCAEALAWRLAVASRAVHGDFCIGDGGTDTHGRGGVVVSFPNADPPPTTTQPQGLPEPGPCEHGETPPEPTPHGRRCGVEQRGHPHSPGGPEERDGHSFRSLEFWPSADWYTVLCAAANAPTPPGRRPRRGHAPHVAALGAALDAPPLASLTLVELVGVPSVFWAAAAAFRCGRGTTGSPQWDLQLARARGAVFACPFGLACPLWADGCPCDHPTSEPPTSSESPPGNEDLPG